MTVPADRAIVDSSPPAGTVSSGTGPVEVAASKTSGQENFPVGSWLLPKRLRPHIANFYRFARAADLGVTGRVSAVDDGRMLATSWRWDGEDHETAVTIELAPEGEGTRVVVRQVGFPDERAVADHVTGWNDCLGRLAATA